MKKIAIGLLALLIILSAGGYVFLSNLDHIIKAAVEKYASAATQADVRLDAVKLSLTSGEGSLNGLSIGNPKGFTTPQAFYLGLISVKLDTASIKGTGPIVISQIIIDKPQVTYELLNNGSSNMQTIQNNAQTYANSFQSKSPAAQPPATNAAPTEPQKDQPGRKIVINDLVVRNGQVAISQTLLKGRQLSVPLPEIHLTNIGKNSNGATASQVTQQLLTAISNSAAQASVTELAKEKINGLLKAVPASAIGGAAVDTMGNSIKGVFGP